ncbi:hypothetical protein IWZ03DRAFT_386415, partial [Phyllosticta citriasiana]
MAWYGKVRSRMVLVWDRTPPVDCLTGWLSGPLGITAPFASSFHPSPFHFSPSVCLSVYLSVCLSLCAVGCVQFVHTAIVIVVVIFVFIAVALLLSSIYPSLSCVPLYRPLQLHHLFSVQYTHLQPPSPTTIIFTTESSRVVTRH